MNGVPVEQRRDTEANGRVDQSEPTQAPGIHRRLALTRKQRFGLPLLAAIPILAVFGVFGERRAEIRVQSRSVVADIRYPERFRYRQSQSLEISVRNVSARAMDTVHVWLDTAYLTRFAAVRIQPPPRSAFAVDLTGLMPGESRLITAELSGDRYGRHRGRIVVSTNGDSATASLSTLVFP